ncbi:MULTISPECIES: cytochrome b N-terminal domain-containing protein [unclassified Sphingomonas]|uniref:cytochrome b n=1 Tax=unclassified Sphingomonas TaxID=196159 RepID=UPI000927D1D8|nr:MULTISPECIES: cytochrome b N-terminal domain-containing protein [unclassified Sphingomonas]MBN8846593.1 cytochrome b N-terminal domain-containing protein [Sphingomonas sp.]MBS0283304.1 cytochrome b N-terminal domain-containing protein [Pseudomonadota bacterium]OJV32779.1 MAG: cytochrome b [Sphingomonas sp. 67-36]
MSFPWAKHYEPKQPLMRWLDEKLPLPRLVYNAIGAGYPVPRNLNYWWNFGVLAGVALVCQIVTGIVLAMHYAPNALVAFGSTEHIMRDVNGGWFLRYAHANGASMFLAVVYVHIGRGLYYGSYKAPREMVWLLGVVIFLLMMATAFMGYVLPWGQMSFWGAQVITGFFSAIPGVGETVRIWLLGGFAPDNAALNRFFSLHYLLPFVIAAVIILHIWALHIPGSNNPTGVDVKGEQDTVPFHPYYTAKDGVGVGAFFLVFALLVFFSPNLLGHPDNYIEANPLSTPAHIVPEWYFLPFYAILKSFTFNFLWIPAKLWGVLAMFGSILLLFFLPWLDSSPVRSANYRPTYRWFLLVLLIDVLVLGYVGGAEPIARNVIMGQIASIYYFAHFLIILPWVARSERPRPLPNSITEAVLAKHGGTSPAETALAH